MIVATKFNYIYTKYQRQRQRLFCQKRGKQGFEIMKYAKHLGLALAAMTLSAAATAATDSSTIAVSASIAAACSVGVGTEMAFGAITMINTDGAKTSTDSTATSTFPAICTTGTTAPTFTYESANAGAGGVFRLRGGTTTTEFLPYSLFPASSATGTAIVSGTAVAYTGFTVNGVSNALSLTGQIAAASKAGQSVQSYGDTITVTVTFP